MYEFAIKKQIKRTRWKDTERIKKEEIGQWIENNPDKRAYFHTIQSFKTSQRIADEKHWVDLYFDFDADKDKGFELIEAISRIYDYEERESSFITSYSSSVYS